MAIMRIRYFIFIVISLFFLVMTSSTFALTEKEKLAKAHPRYAELLNHDEALEFIFGKNVQIEEKEVVLDEEDRKSVV